MPLAAGHVSDDLGARDQNTPCGGTTRAGAPCRMRPLVGAPYCWNHSPDGGADRARARRLGGLRRRRGSPEGVPDRLTLGTVADARALLERAARDALVLDNSPDRCRVLLAAVGQALRVLEVGEMESRLAALETRLGASRPPGRALAMSR